MVTPNLEFSKIIALFIVQLVGIAVAGISAYNLKNCTNINESTSSRMLGIASITFLITIISFVLYGDTFISIYYAFSRSNSTKPWWIPLEFLSFSDIISIYAISDILALTYYIYKTGGPRQSVYVPFLLIIVPLAIILRDDIWKILIYLSLTLIVYSLCLFRLKDDNFQVHIDKSYSYDIHLAIITALCFIFPTGLSLL